MEGSTTKRDFREKRKSGEVFPFGENFCIFDLPSLDSLSLGGGGGGGKTFQGGGRPT